MQVPASYSDFLARLQSLAFDQCFSLTNKQSSIFANQAYHAGGGQREQGGVVVGSLALEATSLMSCVCVVLHPHAQPLLQLTNTSTLHPGGLFISSVTGFQSDSCDDLNHPVSGTKPQPSLAPYVAQSNISGLVNCSRVGAGASTRSLLQGSSTANTVVVGYGPDVATMAHGVDIERADTVLLELGGLGAKDPLPQVREHRRGAIAIPILHLHSSSPLPRSAL
jgi:hypothetical protein